MAGAGVWIEIFTKGNKKSKRDDDLIDKFIKFLADIGRGLERNCSDKVIAIILVIVA